MRDLVKPVLENKAKKIKRTPCYTNRASSLGYFVEYIGGCTRRGVYEITHWKEKELHDIKLQLIFDEGNRQERHVLNDLSDSGVDIIEQQTPFQWSEYNITGHVDGKYVEDGIAYPIDIKSMHPNIFDTIYTADDFNKRPHTKVYIVQLNLYMLMHNVDKGIFILKNKSNGMLRQITIDLDYNLCEECLKTAENINSHIAYDTIPERIIDRDVCKKCPFKITCLPDIDFGVPLKIVDDPSFESKIDMYISIVENKKHAEKLWEEIKETCKASAENNELNINVGKYLITGKTDKKGSFRTKVELI